MYVLIVYFTTIKISYVQHNTQFIEESKIKYANHHHHDDDTMNTPTNNPNNPNDNPNDNPNENSTTTNNNESTKNQQSHRPFLGQYLNLPKPGTIINAITSNAPRLIGWNDDDFRRLIEDAREKKRQELIKTGEIDENFSVKDVELDIEKYGFGLQGIVSNAFKEYVYEKTNFDDLKSDLRKIEAIGVSKPSDLFGELDEEGVRKKNISFDMKEMKLYQNLLLTLKYQRDVYIMGEEYATRRRHERKMLVLQKQQEEEHKQKQNELSLAFPFGMNSLTGKKSNKEYTTYKEYLHDHQTIPYHQQTSQESSKASSSSSSSKSETGSFPTAIVTTKSSTSTSKSNDDHDTADTSLASTQLTNLAQWFIPSRTMHDALLPTVLWTIAPPMAHPHYLPQGGPLREQILQSSVALLPLSQPLLDQTVKNNLIYVFGNKEWRDSMKGTTRGMVGRNMQQDGNGNAENDAALNGRFVTTKSVQTKSHRF